MHASERLKPTNSVRLLALSSSKTEVVLVGAQPPHPYPVLDRESSYVLFPGPDAITLTEDAVLKIPQPLTLVVPDGSWRQARKIARRYEPIVGLKQAQLPEGVRSNYHVRKKQREGGVCTLEAISAALDVIEGGSTGATLRDLCREMVRRVMWTRNGGGGPLPNDYCVA